MYAFNIKQSEMARLTKRSRQVMRKSKKTYKKKASYKKKTYKSSSKGYKSKSIRQMAKKLTSSHYLSYGVSAIRKKYVAPGLTSSLKTQGFNTWSDAYGSLSAATAGAQSIKTVCGVYTPYDVYKANADSLNKYYLKTATLAITMTNQCNAPVFVDLYDMVARQDLNSASQFSTPTEAWTNAGDNPTYYGADPFGVQGVTETFKILRITRINLTAGETAEHRCTYNANQVFSKQDLIAFAATPTKDEDAFGGLTHYIMMVTRGAPADADDNTVGSSITKVDYIVQKTYKFQSVPNVTNDNTVNTTLATTATKIMELDGDENTFITA